MTHTMTADFVNRVNVARPTVRPGEEVAKAVLAAERREKCQPCGGKGYFDGWINLPDGDVCETTRLCGVCGGTGRAKQ